MDASNDSNIRKSISLTMAPSSSYPPTATATSSPFALLSDDLLLLILSKLDSDPRQWPRLCCVSPRLSALIRSSCYPSLCLRCLPAPLLPTSPSSSASLIKLSLCCPGPLLAGVPLPSPSPFPHTAPNPWSLSREEGAKLLAGRFRHDPLFLSPWPGCLHRVGHRDYMLFRGVFLQFRGSGVWRATGDGARGRRPGVPCAFCACPETWDLHALSCLRRVFECHEDGEPVVHAYVCGNGHVAGAWTERRMYI